MSSSFEKFIFQLNEGTSRWGGGDIRNCDGFSVTFPIPVKILRKDLLERLKEGVQYG